jgi:rubrerythrin
MAATFIEQVARYEEAVAKFYACCATMLPDDKEFWLALSDQEIWHAKVLRILKDAVKEKKVQLLPERFNIKEIEIAFEYVQQMTKITRVQGIELDKALEIACRIEHNTVECKVFAAFDESPPEVKDRFKVIHEQERMHVELLTSRMRDAVAKKDTQSWVKRLLSISGMGKSK